MDPATEHDKDNPQNGNASEPITKKKYKETILDVLNMDCWRAVLDYLDVDDVVRSERVSRGWQRVVQEYLQGVHSYYIDTYHAHTTRVNDYDKYYKYHKLKSKKHFCKKMFKKMGPLIVTLLADHFIIEMFHLMTINCPNLQDLTCFRAKNPYPLGYHGLYDCKRLKRVTFESCIKLYEDDLIQLLDHKTLEELVINNSDNVSGHFLTNLRSNNLKKLALNRCQNLDLGHILFAASDLLLLELKALELNHPPDSPEIFENLHLLLDKTPQLEHLSLNVGDPRDLLCNNKIIVNTELIESIGRLSCLKHLSLDGIATDALLMSVVRCHELRTLSIENCRGVSGRVLVSLCQKLLALAELSVAGSPNLSEEDLITCITCSGLTMLDVSWCKQVTVALVKAAARAVRRRPRPLRLRLYQTPVTSDIDRLFAEEKSMGLALSWWKNSIQYFDYPDYDTDSDSDEWR